MLKRWSRNGWFLGCANYPECKSTRDLGADGTPTVPRETGIACDKCGKGMVIRSGRFGEFLSCTGYPECKNAKPVPLGVKCPKCGGRHHRDSLEEARRQAVLRLLELRERSGQVRLQALAKAHRRAVPGLRRAVPRHGRDAGEADDRLREQGVRLQASGRRASLRGDRSLDRRRPRRSLRALSVARIPSRPTFAGDGRIRPVL